MDFKNTSENSPFYDEYNGTTKKTKTYGYHVKKDFQKPLKEFFDARFGTDASDNEIMEEIVQHYYFSFAHERTYYDETIIVLIHKSELDKNNPRFMPILIGHGFADNDFGTLIDDKEYKRATAFQFRAYTRLYKDIDVTIKDAIVKSVFDDGYKVKRTNIFADWKNFNEDMLNDFIVLQIPLNNYLDAYQNGIYAYLQDDGDLRENQHCGVVIANSKHEIPGVEPFIITFNWILYSNFEIDVLDVVKLSESDLARLIDKYNVALVTVLNPILNFGYSLQKKLDEKDKLINELKLMLNHEENERLKIVDAIEKEKLDQLHNDSNG